MYLIMFSVKQEGIKYHFLKVFGMIRPGIEPQSPGHSTHKTNEPLMYTHT